MTDVIYLAPLCQEHERMWCEHDAPVDCECVDGPHPWIKYVAAPKQPTQSDALLDAEGVKLYWYRQGKDDGVEHERAKIVAWLMREEDDYPSGKYSGFAAIIREEIEAGEHLK